MPSRFAIVTPVFNDWECFSQLCGCLDRLARNNNLEIDVIAVDDGSQDPAPKMIFEDGHAALKSIEVIELHCNLGHQRAIAVALSVLAERSDHDFVVVMDADGEDAPDDILRLIAAHEDSPNAIILAQRVKRSEGPLFVVMYTLYKLLFRGMTGQAVSFGNFSLLPRAAVLRLSHSPSLWNSLTATVLRSRIPLRLVPVVRARRFSGTTKMNLISLSVHGLQAISEFGETVMVRMAILTLTITGLGFLGVLVLRLFTGLLQPGWASSLSAIFFAIVVLLIAILIGTTLIVLNNRSMMPMLLTRYVADFIRAIRRLY